jgi:hypothetical protein
VGGPLCHAPEKGRVNRPAIQIIDARKPAHTTSEVKEKRKAPDALRRVAYHLAPQLDPRMTIEGSGLLTDANQEFCRLPACLEQPK